MLDKKLLAGLDPRDSEEIQKIALGIKEKMERENLSLKEAVGVNDSLLEEMYALAYNRYNQGRYEEAKICFQFLATLESEEYTYLLGLAATLHQLEEYDSAIYMFFAAWHLDHDNPTPTYYIADSFLKREQIEGARKFLTLTIETIDRVGGHEALKERCQLTLSGLNGKKE